MTTLRIPELSLVVLIGASGSGKSSFARKHFAATEVISSDACRGLVADDENDQAATGAAFEVLHLIARKRLAAGRLTVIDATSVRPEDRALLIALAREFHVLPVAIAFDLSPKVCQARNDSRPDRAFGTHVVRQQSQALRRGLRGLQREGFRRVHVLETVEQVDAAVIERERLWTDRRDHHGPFDLIGDVHGCFDELLLLLGKLGYVRDGDGARHPDGRTAVFVGDLVDRGPASPDVVKLVIAMREAGTALCVIGNHERKLLRKLHGREVKLGHGLAETMEQLDREPPALRDRIAAFIDDLVSHYVLDDGKLVVAHAGLKEELQGRASGAVREFAMYGETTGETDEFGLPVRLDWAASYRGKAMVVYGHVPTLEPEWLNRTICIDQGCVFGGKLTALRYPERELVQVDAARVYYEPIKPMAPPRAERTAFASDRPHDLLDLDDVIGKRQVETRLHHRVTIRAENAAAALEVMSRFAVDPRWLIYLPPTMSPPATHKDGALLEHPSEVLDYYRAEGVTRVVCEEKHMGSRAVIVVARDAAAAARRFGIASEAGGVIYTRTGRRFFHDEADERGVLDRLRGALDRTGAWATFATDWFALDAEIMPWSAKAQALLRQQYAPTATAARAGLDAALAALQQGASRDDGSLALLRRFEARAACTARYADAYARYCWPVESIDDLRIAPFHLLASEGKVHVDRDHLWHMAELAAICAADPALLLATRHLETDLLDDASCARAVHWWEQLTDAGGEGMVVKPLDWLVRGRHGLVQPAVKCRGPEYLRIIYGPEYSLPEHLIRLRERGLSTKRSLALRELSLGLEGLERFVANEPLYRVHECAFAVLALESEPVDPRL
jgi:protein phosphatase